MMRKLFQLSLLKTLRLNFRYLKFKDAIKLPILVGRSVRFRTLKGEIKIEGEIRSGMIQIGFDTLGLVDWRNQRAIIQNEGMIVFKGNASIGAASRIIVLKGGNFVLGSNFSLTGQSSIISKKRVEIGDDCLISWDVQIMDTDFHKILDEEGSTINADADITIGNRVWLGSRVAIMKGTSIADGSIIGAGSLVSGHLTDNNTIYVGAPVRPLKRGIYWHI